MKEKKEELDKVCSWLKYYDLSFTVIKSELDEYD